MAAGDGDMRPNWQRFVVYSPISGPCCCFHSQKYVVAVVLVERSAAESVVGEFSDLERLVRQYQTHRFCHGLAFDIRSLDSATAQVGGINTRGQAEKKQPLRTDRLRFGQARPVGSFRHGVHL